MEINIQTSRDPLGKFNLLTGFFVSFSALNHLFSSSLQHQVAHEGETGKVSRASFHDRQGRVVLIMRPTMQVRKRSFHTFF